MQSNMVQTEQDFGGQKNIAKISDNATNHLNRQTLEATDSNANKQAIEAQQQATNNQLIEDTQIEKNVQLINAGHALNSDRVGLPGDKYSDKRVPLPTGVRLENLFFNIHELSSKLDNFELRNKKFLQEAIIYDIELSENALKTEQPQTHPQLPSDVPVTVCHTQELKTSDNSPSLDNADIAPIHAQAQLKTSVNQPKKSNSSTLRVDMKTVVAFVVLTFWASNVKVADTMHSQQAAGFLQKITE